MQNVSVTSQAFDAVGEIQFVFIDPLRRNGDDAQDVPALGPRRVNIGDDNDSSIAADNPGEWLVCSNEIPRCLQARSRRGRSHLFWSDSGEESN